MATKTITVVLSGDIPPIGKEGDRVLVRVGNDGQPLELRWRRFLKDGSAKLTKPTTKKPPASDAGDSTGG